jgi:hypothetical protein
MALVLESKVGGDFKPHVEGIHNAVCVDVINLGLVETEFQGQRRLVNKVRIVFETEQRTEDGRNCTISKTYTASLHPKAKLTEGLGKWRGRPVMPGESIDLDKLIGACATLVISHQTSLAGRTYASIDAISKPTKRLVASGGYDPVLARQRIAEWKAREAVGSDQRSVTSNQSRSASPRTIPPVPTRPSSGAGAQPKSVAPSAAPTGTTDFDPEVGF